MAAKLPTRCSCKVPGTGRTGQNTVACRPELRVVFMEADILRSSRARLLNSTPFCQNYEQHKDIRDSYNGWG
ncbi:hypothetical protein IG631_02692 [Alternaria alternata]|nr:hypothetical protein IG631_02692 [Alternaria alternata]